jgi:hypothetical protein
LRTPRYQTPARRNLSASFERVLRLESDEELQTRGLGHKNGALLTRTSGARRRCAFRPFEPTFAKLSPSRVPVLVGVHAARTRPSWAPLRRPKVRKNRQTLRSTGRPSIGRGSFTRPGAAVRKAPSFLAIANPPSEANLLLAQDP